jgi:hypothetical protein
MLDPGCRAILETEANYGAGRLLFLQDRFASEARDLPLSFEAIRQMAKRYGNSIVSTFWRAVEDRDPAWPVFGLISVHPRHPEIGSHDGTEPWRYFIRSAAFGSRFSHVTAQNVFDMVVRHAGASRRGPILHALEALHDARGAPWEFEIESFSNSHQLLTLGVARRERPAQA